MMMIDIIFLEKKFYETSEINGLKNFKTPLRSNAILNIQNIEKYCFLWSKLAYLHPCENSHPSRVRNFSQNVIELFIECFDFTSAFSCSDVHRFEKKTIYL